MIKLDTVQRGQVSRFINDQKRWHGKVSLRKVLSYANHLVEMERTRPQRLAEIEKTNARLRANNDSSSELQRAALIRENLNERFIDNNGFSSF